MEQFDLQEYLKNPTRPIVTRDGRAARVLCTDRISDIYPVVALVRNEEGEAVRTFHENGECFLMDESPDPCDLFFAPEPKTKKEGWVNLYRADEELLVLGHLYNTEEEAFENKSSASVYMTTVKIEWEE